MAKPPKKDDKRPDAWGRFERAVDAAVAGGPKHRTAKPRANKRQGKRRQGEGPNRRKP